jgi:branched-chain amino acid transport system substrate-binding protein
MLKRMICHWVVLAGLMVVLTCLASSAEPLKIGVVAPLTGPAAEQGREKIQGAKLATEEVNKAGGVLGRPIELVIEDDQTTNLGVVCSRSASLRGTRIFPRSSGRFLAPRSTP